MNDQATYTEGLKTPEAPVNIYNSVHISTASLIAMYTAIYGELRDKDARQQQAVSWGTGILASAGVFALMGGSHSNQAAAYAVVGVLIVVTVILVKLILHLAEDRRSLARTLDQIHLVMGAFEEGSYAPSVTLFPSNWRGWGTNPNTDANTQQAQQYCALLAAAFAIDAVLLVFHPQ